MASFKCAIRISPPVLPSTATLLSVENLQVVQTTILRMMCKGDEPVVKVYGCLVD
jgi:hypothetical protein